MKIKLLTRSTDLNKILLAKLDQIGLTAETIDYKKSILPQIEDADVIVNGFGNIDKSLIDGCPKLELIQQTVIGIDHVDVGYCTSKSILVANVALANAVSVEKTLSTNNNSNNRPAALLFERRILGILCSEIQRKVLVVIGLGATGLEVAKRAKSFGMHVIAVTKNPFLKKPGVDKAYFVNNLGGSEILSESISRADYVSLHTPLTAETKNMIGTKEIALMKKSAYLLSSHSYSK